MFCALLFRSVVPFHVLRIDTTTEKNRTKAQSFCVDARRIRIAFPFPGNCRHVHFERIALRVFSWKAKQIHLLHENGKCLIYSLLRFAIVYKMLNTLFIENYIQRILSTTSLRPSFVCSLLFFIYLAVFVAWR